MGAREKKEEEEGRKMAIRQFLLFSGAIFSRAHPALLNLEPSSQVKNSPLIFFSFKLIGGKMMLLPRRVGNSRRARGFEKKENLSNLAPDLFIPRPAVSERAFFWYRILFLPSFLSFSLK